jgi:tetratricopeptide (TPR) repeat protein
VDAPRAAANRLDTLAAHARSGGEDLFARTIDILALGVRAWTAQAARDTANAVTLMRRAVELEEATPKNPVTPAPTIPAPELLGDLLMEQGKPSEAAAAYRRSLELYPKRRNSSRGLTRATTPRR